MKTNKLNKGDTLLITQDFLNDNFKRGNAGVSSVWVLGETCKVCDLSDYSTVRVHRGLWSIWIDNNLAESMRDAYINRNAQGHNYY
jgi:hypothetical protein